MSPADCNSIGISGETERRCEDGYVCIDHQCGLQPDAPLAPPCETNDDCMAPKAYCAPEKVCVACLASEHCSGATPVCEATTHECRACTVDDECASTVCDRASGACIDEAVVLYASPSGSSSSSCTKAQPCTILRSISLADTTRQTIKLLAGTYNTSITLNKPLAIYGFGATLNATAGMRTIEIDNGAQVRLLGLTIVNINANQGLGVSCQPAVTDPKPTVELDEVTIDSMQTALTAYPCTVVITRSRIYTRTASERIITALPTSSVTIDRSVLDGGDGIWVEGTNSVARVTNSVIKNQTGPEGAFIGSNVFGQGAGSVSVRFSTVVNSLVRCGNALPKCAGGTAAGSCIESSIIYNGSSGAPSNTIESGCTVNYSLVFPQSSAPSGANNILGVNPMFKDFAGADYHLAPGSAAIDAADPAANVTIDYDGTARPQGTRSDIGAFEHKP